MVSDRLFGARRQAKKASGTAVLFLGPKKTHQKKWPLLAERPFLLSLYFQCLRLKIKSIGVHHLRPGCNEVSNELFAVVVLSITLGIRPQD